MNNLYLADFDKRVEYHKDLIDFYKIKSKNKRFACIQICFHYNLLQRTSWEIRKDFIDFLRSSDAFQYLSESTRSRYLAVN